MPFLDACAAATWGLAIRIERDFPPPATEWLARVLARAAFSVHVPARRHLESNLRRLLPRESVSATRVSRLALRSFEEFALVFADMLRLDRLDAAALAQSCEVAGTDHLEAARASGRGVVLMSSHAGNWEWGAAWLSDAGYPVRVLARRHGDAIERLLERRRHSHRVRRLTAGGEGGPMWIAAARALRRGEWVALLGDRACTGTRRALSAWGLAVARRGGALILPAAMSRLGRGRYRIVFEPPLEPRTLYRERLGESVLAQARREPAQWFGFEPLPENAA
jgi:KDO2-lipid IV(A) lauroyltransferase